MTRPSRRLLPANRLLGLAMLLPLVVSGCASYGAAPLSIDAGLPRPLIADAANLAPVIHPRLATKPLDLNRPLDELDLARLALILSPELAAQRAQVGVAQAQLFAAGLLPDPQLSLVLDKPYDPTLVNALAGSLGFELGSLLTHSAQKDSKHAVLAKVHSDVAWSEWLAINQVRTLSRRIFFLQRQLKIAEDATAVAGKIYRLSAGNTRRGDAKLDETTLLQVGFLDAQDRSLALRRNLAAARQQLNAAIGLAPDASLSLAEPSARQNVAALDPTQLTQLALRQRFDLQALREGYAAQEADLRRAVRASIPLPQLSLDRARDTGAVWTHGLGIALSLPLWNRGRGDIKIASATRSQLAAEYAARVHQTQNDIAAADADLQAINAERGALADEIPILTHAAEVIGKAARAGNLPLITYETIRASLLDKQLALSALEQAQAEGEVALETAVGDRLWPSP